MIPCISRVSHCKSLVGSDSDHTSNTFFLSKFKLYESKARFYLVGTDKSRTRWKILKIDRLSSGGELDIFEDPAIYSQHDCNDLLSRLGAGNKSSGGLKFVTKAYGIVGFIKFLEPYYIILVTKRKLLGNICGHSIYGIAERKLIALPHESIQTTVTASQAENRYKKLFNSIDLKKDFFFSYTYKIMWSLQVNVLRGEGEGVPYEDMFVWNSFLTSKVRQQMHSLHWTVALVHGYFKQTTLRTHGTNNYKATLIARRSRHFAGTRYLKRGVNDKGQVANDVETEQLLHEETCQGTGHITSVVQHRGSIPLFWSQDTSFLSPRPDIKLQKCDKVYRATRLHFENLVARYGNPIVILNLVKTMEKKPREMVLCCEFANAVEYVNHDLPKEHQIKFIQWDLHKFSKSDCPNVLDILGGITADALKQVGIFHSIVQQNEKDTENQIGMTTKEQTKCMADSIQEKKLQHGVLRSNCIDCLDRTNVAQYSFGLAALGQQINTLGLSDATQVSPESSDGVLLMDMYEKMGDALALQYGGSTAHNTVLSNRQGKWKAATQSLDLIRAIKRHYSNAYTDGLKQDAINIFLGHYHPDLSKPPLWQLGSDAHLQIRRQEASALNNYKVSFKRSLSAGNMLDQTSHCSVGFQLTHPTLDQVSIESIITTGSFREDFASCNAADGVNLANGQVESVCERQRPGVPSESSYYGSIFLPVTYEGMEVEDEVCCQPSDNVAVLSKGAKVELGAALHAKDRSVFCAEKEALNDKSRDSLSLETTKTADTFEFSDAFHNCVHSNFTFFQSFSYTQPISSTTSVS